MTTALIILAVLIAIWVLRSVWKTLTTVDETPPPNGGYDAPVWRENPPPTQSEPPSQRALTKSENIEIVIDDWPHKLSKDVSITIEGDKEKAINLIRNVLNSKKGFLLTSGMVADEIVWSSLYCPEVEAYRENFIKELETKVSAHLKTHSYERDPDLTQEEQAESDFEEALYDIDDANEDTLKSRPCMAGLALPDIYSRMKLSRKSCPIDTIVKSGLKDKHVFRLHRYGYLFSEPRALTAEQLIDIEPLEELNLIIQPDEITPENIIKAYTIKDLQQAVGSSAKRKSGYSELLTASNRTHLPGYKSLRMLSHLDDEKFKVAEYYAWASVHAELLTLTLLTYGNTLESIKEGKREIRALRKDGIDAVWQIDGECCEKSRSLSLERVTDLRKGYPPFHIGCEATIQWGD